MIKKYILWIIKKSGGVKEAIISILIGTFIEWELLAIFRRL